jgi:hypothetical protein
MGKMGKPPHLQTRTWIMTRYHILESALSRFLDANPSLIERVDGREFINIRKKLFTAWRESYEKELAEGGGDPGEVSRRAEMKQLEREALAAEWELKKSKAEQKRIQVERETLALRERRRELIDHDRARHYYLSYVEKVNLEVFRVDKALLDHLRTRLGHLLKAEDLHDFLVEFKDLISRELEAAIKDVITSQVEAVKKWE